jgi:hypothetical protein
VSASVDAADAAGPSRRVEGHRPAAAIALLASASTLLCCALPALLVSLGAGATLVALIGAVPQLVWLSEHKLPLFAVSGLLLAGAGVLQWRARTLPCPVDPALANACGRARRTSLSVWAASAALYGLGVAFAFVLPALG